MEYKNRKFICIHCKGGFTAYINKGGRKFCSVECGFNHHRIVRVCPQCGKKKIGERAKPKKDFCSKVCWNIFKRKKAVYVCKVCNKKIKGFPSKKRNFCSHKCYWENKKLPTDIYNERRNKYNRKYRKENPDKYQTYKNNRRAREMNAEGSFTKSEWQELKKKYNHRCIDCKKSEPDIKLTVDHVIPLTKRGTNFIENIEPRCQSCNSRKGTKIMV